MPDLTQSLTEIGRTFGAWCVTTNLSTLTLLAIALVIDLLIARRLSPAWRIALYLPVFLRVVVPPSATWSLPFWKLAAPAVFASCPVDDPAACAPAANLAAPITTSSPASLWPLAFLALYAAGVTAFLSCWVRGTHNIRRIVQASHSRIQDPTVLISPASGPMVVGLRHPRIVIPAWLARSDALPLILAHERAHIARRDPVFAFAIRALCAIAWPVLPLWIAASRVRALMEQACDDYALGSPTARRKENVMKYAETMIEIAQRSTRLPGSLAFGAAVRSRIKALRTTRRWPAAIQISIAFALPTLLLACSAARPQTESVTLSPAMLTPSPLAPTTPAAKPFSETEVLSNTDLNAQRELNAAPEANQATRVINITIVSGDAPWPSEQVDKWNPSVDAIDRDSTSNQFAWIQNTRFETAPRLVVTVGQPAAIRTDIDRRPVAMQFTVLPSDADTVLATMTYTEGNQYTLKATTLRLNKGQACIVRIPSAQFGGETRTLIINIDRPGEEPGC